MSTTNQIRRSYQNDQSVCIIACHGITTQFCKSPPLKWLQRWPRALSPDVIKLSGVDL